MHLPQSCHRGFLPFGLESKKKASLTIVCATWWFKVRKCMYWRELFEKLGGREKICLSPLPGTDIMFCLTRKIWPPCFQNFLDSIATCREWKKAWWALQKTGTMQKLYSRGPPSRPTRWCVQSQKDLPSAHHHAVTTHLLTRDGTIAVSFRSIPSGHLERMPHCSCRLERSLPFPWTVHRNWW
jgi:hypothetical protein